MANYTTKRIDDMEAVAFGTFKRARAELGVESFGVQVLDLPPNLEAYPEHDHGDDGQEEVYVLLRGSAEVEVEGERIPIDTETMIRIPSGVTRKIYTGGEPARILAIGGVPGKVYEAPEVSRLGGPDPMEQVQQS